MCAIKSYSRLCIALAVFIPLAASSRAQEASYTVAGDVPSPGTYSHPIGEPMNLAQLLEKAGVNGEKGIAAILRRPSLDTVSTNSIRPDSGPNLTPVAPGDVVVFRRYEPHGIFKPHAVLISGGEPRIVPLSEGAHSLGHVMAAEGLRFSEPANVIRVKWGSTDRLLLNGNAGVMNGDVVNVANAGPMSGLRITETFAQPAVAVVHTSVGAVVPSDGGLNPVPSASSSLIVPPKPQSATLHIPDAESSSDLMVTTAVSEARTAALEFGDGIQMELRIPDSSETQENSTPFRNASLENSFPEAETFELADSQLASTADSSSNGILNTVFVVGLLFAIGLICVGWLKTQQERRMEVEMAQSLQNSTKISSPEPTPEVADIALAEADTAVNNKTVSDDCPVLSAGIEEEVVEPESSNVQESLWEEMETSNSSVLPETVDTVVLAPEDGPWFDAGWSSAAAEFEAEVKPEAKAPNSPVAKSDLLEDLLQNRLPMELKQAQLPLQVALFGKPAGPQRIRIDAAHTTIAAPHMASSAKRAKRKTSVAAAKTTNEPRRNQQRSDSAQSAVDGSPFDRALNFLEEQSEQ